MIAAAAAFLYLLPLAALPIVFHLLMRRRRRKLLFSTLMFFHRVDPRLSARRRLQQWLLLLARVLLIATVLLGLARLTIKSYGGVLGLGGKQSVVVLVDNSASMDAPGPGGQRTKLRIAVESARALLANLDADAEAGVVTLVADFQAGLGEGMSRDKQTLAKILDRIGPTEASGNVPRALSQAVGLLNSSGSGGTGAIHIFTDLQETEWAHQAAKEGDLGGNVEVIFHRIPTPAPETPNVALAQAELIGQRILPRQPYFIRVALRNDGNRPVSVRLNSRDDQRKTTTENVEVLAGAEKVVTLLVQPEAAGYHWVNVWIEGDSFAGDNRASIGYLCENMATVCFAGTQAAYGALPIALSPFGDGRVTSLVPVYCPITELRAKAEQCRAIAVVLTWADLGDLDPKDAAWLKEYVSQGGNLVVVPPARGEAVPGKTPDWLGAGIGAKETLQREARLAILDKKSPFWDDLRDAERRIRAVQVFARQYCPLTLDKQALYTPLLGQGFDKVTLALRALGKGQLAVSGMAFERQWNSLPQDKLFVVLAQALALGAGKARPSAGLSLVAGTAPTAIPGKSEEVRIITLFGDPVDWSGPRSQVPVFPRNGAYQVRAGDEQVCVSVRASDQEGSPKFIEGPVVPALGRVPHTVRTLKDDEDFKADLEAQRTGLELYLPLLLLAMLVLVAEGLLGSPPLRRAKTRKAEAGDQSSEPLAAQEAQVEVEPESAASASTAA